MCACTRIYLLCLYARAYFIARIRRKTRHFVKTVFFFLYFILAYQGPINCALPYANVYQIAFCTFQTFPRANCNFQRFFLSRACFHPPAKMYSSNFRVFKKIRCRDVGLFFFFLLGVIKTNEFLITSCYAKYPRTPVVGQINYTHLVASLYAAAFSIHGPFHRVSCRMLYHAYINLCMCARVKSLLKKVLP